MPKGLLIEKNEYDSEMLNIYSEKGKVLWGVIHVDMISHASEDWSKIADMLDEGPLQLKIADMEGNIL